MTSSCPIPLATVALALVSGCAAAAAPASSSSATAAAESDCSFRSATTCWSLAPRLSAVRSARKGPAPDQLQAPPQPVLASRADNLSSP
jgi:hypothetical protein